VGQSQAIRLGGMVSLKLAIRRLNLLGAGVGMEGLAGRVILLSGWRRSLLAFAAGVAAALALPPFDFFAACFVAFPILVWLLDGAVGERRGLFARFRPAFSVGWWFGFGYFLFGLWWIGKALLVDAENFAWAFPFAAVGLPAFLALFYGIAAALARVLWSDGILRIFALAFSFALMEWLRANILTGFPWNSIGYAAMPTVLTMQSAKVFGLNGMNALAVLAFSLPSLIGTRKNRTIGICLLAGLLALHLGYGYARLQSKEEAGKSIAIRIVQPSVLQDEKWDAAEQSRIFALLLDLSNAPVPEGGAKPDVIVWPETAVPFLFGDRPEALVQIGSMLEDGQTLLAGAVRVETGEVSAGERYYNSVVAIGSDGVIQDAVDKLHLVPFGEYLPFKSVLENFGLGPVVHAIGPYSSGSSRHAITVAKEARILPFICYEVIFPQLLSDAQNKSDILLNVTNDAWFGVSPGPYQHFRQAQIRAVETGLPLVRAANNGISAVVDPYGRVVDALDLNAVGVLDVRLVMQRGDKFSFTLPGTNAPFLALCFGLMALLGRSIRRLSPN